MKKLIILISVMLGTLSLSAQCKCCHAARLAEQEKDSGLRDYLEKNVVYPVASQEQNIQGVSRFTFTVDKEGKVKDIVAVKSFDDNCSAEVIKVLSRFPDMIPFNQDGILTERKDSIDVFFMLRGSDIKPVLKPKDTDITIWGYTRTVKKTASAK